MLAHARLCIRGNVEETHSIVLRRIVRGCDYNACCSPKGASGEGTQRSWSGLSEEVDLDA